MASPLYITGAPPWNRDDSMLSIGEFVVSTWHGEGGLPHNAINDVVRDPRGFLWLGTQGGVARFDGRYFIDYPMPGEFAQGRPEIRALAVEDECTMVMLTGHGKLVRLRDGKFEPHPADALIRNASAADLAVDETGALWIGTVAPVSLMRWDGRRMETFGPESGVGRRSSRFCIVSEGKNRTWVASGDFLGWHDTDGLHRHKLLPDYSIMAAKAREGGLWVAGRDRLARFEDGKWRVVLEGADWPAAQVGIQDIYETADGVLWLATRRNGVLRFVDGKLTRLALRHDRVESINEDIDGNVWLGTNGGGLIRLKRKHHVIINTALGMPKDTSSSITEDETGALWFANQSGGPVRIKNGLTLVIRTGSGRIPYASNICADQRGTVWIGALDGLYSTPAVQPSDDARVLRRHDFNITNVQTLFCASGGDVWISWANGRIGRLHDEKLREFTKKEGWPGKRVAGVIEQQGPDGPEIWVATHYGLLFKLAKDSESFAEQPLPPKLKAVQIYALHADADNRLWLATSVGLLLWDKQNPMLFTCADGFPDDVLYQVISDNHNRLWTSSRRGIFCVEIGKLLAAKLAPGRSVPVTLFGRDDNLEGLSGMIGGQPMTWKSRDGRVWFATYRGVVGFDATRPSVETARKQPVYIDGLSANGAYTGIHSGNAPGDSQKPLRIGPHATQVEFSFAALNFSSPERTRVRRMLEGFDLDWIDATGERSSVYSRLLPGKYIFHVESMDAGGSAPGAQSSLVIEIAATWWQTGWFRAAIALVIVFAVAWIARRVSNRILRQRLRRLELEKALDRERVRIARDLHDELGSRISQVGFVADSVCRKADDPRQKEKLSGLAIQSRELVEDLHRIVWTVNPQNDSWQRLAAYISRYTQRLLHDTPITCTIDGVDAIPDIPVTPEIRHHLAAITKEALNNTLKYAQADHIKIQMNADHGHFTMSISDNGRGFDPAALREDDHYGLDNMRERMAEAGGQIEIKAGPGEGTQIMLNISLQYRPPHSPGNSD
ncbi:ATP-binding protein [Termitidicoccus mucosus]